VNVLITGTGRGLGAELATKFVHEGHRVFGISRCSKDHVLSNSLYTHYQGDVASYNRVNEISQSIAAPIDVVINNAGAPGNATKISDVSNDEIQTLLDVNLFGVVNICRAFLGHLQAGQFKRITNISSRFGSLTFNQERAEKQHAISYSYRISKAAQNMLSVCLDNELRGMGISVDAIHPGSFIGGCGRHDAETEARAIASGIYYFVMSEKTKGPVRLLEIGKGELAW